MHPLAADVPVDERLRQPFGGDRGGVEPREAQRQRERAGRGIRPHLDPRAHPAELVARALDEHSAGLQPRRHARPRRGDIALVVLAQHVERPDDRRTPRRRLGGERNLETAAGERDVRIGRERGAPRAHLDKLRLGAGDARRVDLEAHDLDVGARPTQPRLELEGRHAARAIAQIDHERVVRATQHGVPRDPPIDAAQTVRVGGAAGDLPDHGRPAGAAACAGRFFRRHNPILSALCSVG